MDAHVFRHISRLLGSLLQGARVERIHGPVPGVTAFSLFASGAKRCLMLRAHRSAPLLFLTSKNPLPNPPFPAASVMRLRKYCEGRRLGECVSDWVNRRMAFAVPGPGGQRGGWLLLDCKQGPAYIAELPESFAAEAHWPPLPLVPAAVAGDETLWQRFPVLTPLLRRTLACLDADEAAALLVDLEDGNGDLFWYMEGDAPRTVRAWPLPPACRADTNLSPRVTPPESDAVIPLLEAMQLPPLLEVARTAQAAPTVKRDRASTRRDKRRRAKLAAEKERLLKLLPLEDDARRIQANLWRFDPGTRHESITLPPLPGMPDGTEKTVDLNPLLTLPENMQAMFRQAHRAKRGLVAIEARLELAGGTSSPFPAPRSASQPRKTGNAPLPKVPPPSLVQVLTSSDGYTLWRGRSAEGNRLLVKLARPFDLWFHAEDGPGAHLLIRLEHAGEAVPENTLREAAVLAALKSWRKGEPKTSVMAARAKHVRQIKGAAAGAVSVREVWRSFMVTPDEELEEKLVRHGAASATPRS